LAFWLIVDSSAKPVYFYDVSGFFIEFKKDNYNEQYLCELGLNVRQVKAILFVIAHGKISNKEFQEINSISKRTATSELTELVIKYQILIK
jgi:ATP-dependent DNA helicase RecG